MMIVLEILVGLVSLSLLVTLAETLVWWYFWNQHLASSVEHYGKKKAEGRGQRAEGKKEGRGWKAEGRGQKAEGQKEGCKVEGDESRLFSTPYFQVRGQKAEGKDESCKVEGNDKCLAAEHDINRQSSWKNAIVFLTGISDYAAPTLQTEQIEFLQAIGEQFPVDRIIAEPFPYENLTAQRFSRFEIWRRLGFKEPPLWVISLHNFWQTVLVTGLEKTYGNAVASCIINRLGFPASADGTLWFICGSTGASLALAAVPKLREQLQVNLIIIAYGGFFRASPGFDYLERFYHLIGERDIWAKLGQFLFPGRYLPIGVLARASKENRFRVQYTGNHQHLEYLSDDFSVAQTKTYRELTFNTLTKLSVWQEKGLESKRLTTQGVGSRTHPQPLPGGE